MTTSLINYLGRPIGELLKAEPFCGWQVIRSIEKDPDVEIRYEFEGHGVEAICDEFDRISTVFLHRGGDGEALADIPFVLGRKQVFERLGTPSKSGNGVRIPGLADRGPWDKFTLPQGLLHIQYRVGCDEIDLVTLMRPDAVP